MSAQVLDQVASELGQTRGSLESKLQYLRDAGDIDSRHHELGSAVRKASDQAAHDGGSKWSRADAEDLLVFVEALADYVFTFRQRFDQFQARWAKSQ